MTLQTLQVISFFLGYTAYLLLLAFSIVSWIRHTTGRALFLATLSTTGFLVAQGITGESSWTQALEFASLLAWMGLVLRAIGFDLAMIRNSEARGITVVALVAAASGLGGVVLSLMQSDTAAINDDLTALFILKTLLSVCGLVSLEQLVRNTREDLRWKVRYLNIGLGLVFGFSLVHGAVCLLYRSHIGLLTLVQPTVLAFAVPLIIIGSLRNRENEIRFNLSRQFVFRSSVLLFSGGLLILMALVGYYLRATEDDVVTATALLIATIVILALFLVFGSTTVQMRIRRFLSRHLYESAHDYRAYWARVTEQLSEPSPDFSPYQQAIRSVLGVFDATGGAFWRYADGQFVHTASYHAHWKGPLSRQVSERLAGLFESHERPIDLEDPEVNLGTDARGELQSFSDLRFLVPLIVHHDLIGMIGIRNPSMPSALPEEDDDLLLLVSRQAAGFVALHVIDERLSESKQFDTMNRLTAFLTHDLKTTSAQLSLLVENAAQHKTNPEFIDDMLSTVSHSVARMQKLISQIAESRDNQTEAASIGTILPAVVDRFANARPRPLLGAYNPDANVSINRDKLISAIEHTLQNAIHATRDDGTIQVQGLESPPWLDITITDTGSGMNDDFIKTHLFTPFKSTKGVSGMGIGAYQVREYLRAMGGDVIVESTPGKGTCFTLRVPLA